MKGDQTIEELVQAYDPSNGTIATYCDRHGFTIASFYYWRKKLKRKEQTSFLTIRPVEVTTQTICLRMPSGIELQMSNKSRDEIIEWVIELERAYVEF